MPITDEVRESNSPWIKASVRTPTKEDDYYIKYTTGKKETLYASGTGHHKRWSALVDEWLDEEKLSRMVAELEAKDKRIAELEGLLEADKRELLGAFMTFFLQEGEMTCDDRTRKYYVDKFIWNKIL